MTKKQTTPAGARALAINPGATIDDPQVDVPTRENYARAIISVCRKSGLVTARLVLDAEKKLSPDEFKAMTETDLPFGPRKAQRLRVIARNKVLNDPTHESLLPGSWTTLYLLAKLDERLKAQDTLKEWIEKRIIHPKIEREEVEALIKKEIEERKRKAYEEWDKANESAGNGSGDGDDAADQAAEDTQPPSSEDPPHNAGDDAPDITPLPSPTTTSLPSTTTTPPKPGDPTPTQQQTARHDIGPDSAAEAARWRARADELENTKCRLEIQIKGLESEVQEAKAGVGRLAADVRAFLVALVTRVADMEGVRREGLFRTLNQVLADVPTPAPSDGFDIPEFLRREAS
jgi:hypothetical protein